MLSECQGHHCQHRSDDFPAIREILKRHRPRIAVELGTDRGGFAIFLAQTVAAWGGEVVTIDRKRQFVDGWLDARPNLRFVEADVFSAATIAGVSLLLALEPGPALLYCDDGDKTLELQAYHAAIPVGSLLAVHDYGTEVDAAWAERFLAERGFAPEGHAEMEALRNDWYEPMTRFWRRVR